MSDSGLTGKYARHGTQKPFSAEQEFLRLQHENDGSSAGFGKRPISSGAWQFTGDLDTGVLRQALDDVIARHEALRTAVVPAGDGWQQEIRPPAPASLVERALPDTGEPFTTQAERFLNEVEAETFTDVEPPMLWAYLGRFGPTGGVLALVAYLPLIDQWSIQVIMRDVAECYAARAQGRRPELSTVPQYHQYLDEQQDGPSGLETSLAYWRETLTGAQALSLASDRPPADVPSGTTRVDRFTIAPEVGRRGFEFAREQGCSPFMMMFAVHMIQLRRLTGRTDGVVWMLTSGPSRRREAWERTVGYFVNMAPLRTDITGCTTYRQVLERVRTTCIAAYRHEIPFVRLAEGAGDIIGTIEQGGMVVPGFAVFQNPGEESELTAGDITFTAVRRRLSQAAGPGIPDDAILYNIEVDPDGELFYAISSSTDRYDQQTILELADDLRRLFRSVLDAPDQPLPELDDAGA